MVAVIGFRQTSQQVRVRRTFFQEPLPEINALTQFVLAAKNFHGVSCQGGIVAIEFDGAAESLFRLGGLTGAIQQDAKFILKSRLGAVRRGPFLAEGDRLHQVPLFVEDSHFPQGRCVPGWLVGEGFFVEAKRFFLPAQVTRRDADLGENKSVAGMSFQPLGCGRHHCFMLIC